MVAATPSIVTPIRKRRGPAPTGKTPQVSLRLDPAMTAAIDSVVDGDAIQSRSEAIRVILRAWLVANQMMPAVISKAPRQPDTPKRSGS